MQKVEVVSLGRISKKRGPLAGAPCEPLSPEGLSPFDKARDYGLDLEALGL